MITFLSGDFRAPSESNMRIVSEKILGRRTIMKISSRKMDGANWSTP